MSYTEDQLDKIYSRSSGYCHIFHKKLARTNYANFGGRAIRDEDRADYPNALRAAALIYAHFKKEFEIGRTPDEWYLLKHGNNIQNLRN